MSKRKRRKYHDIDRHQKIKRKRNDRRNFQRLVKNKWQEAPGTIKGIFDE